MSVNLSMVNTAVVLMGVSLSRADSTSVPHYTLSGGPYGDVLLFPTASHL